MAEVIPQDIALKLQLAAIAGNEPPESYLELRPLAPVGAQVFVGVRELGKAVQLATGLREDHDVYIGACPRTERRGTGDAVARAWTLWCDCDSEQSVARLRAFRPLPSIVLRTGTPGHLHAYWPLRTPLPPAWARRANLRLAHALGGDKGATDVARVLRAAGTLNHKSSPPRPVECVRLELDVFTFEEVVGHLPDERAWTRPIASPELQPATSPRGLIAGAARVVREARAPTATLPGERNEKLNWAAYRLGQRAAVGEIEADEAERELLAAALDVGLDEREARRTIASGLRASKEAA